MLKHDAVNPDTEESTKVLMKDRLPPEGLEKFENFNKQFRIYFKNQSNAGEIFKVAQVTVSKYLAGKTLVPMPVADRFSKFTNGVVSLDDIYFDYEAYLYDLKNGIKSEKNRSFS